MDGPFKDGISLTRSNLCQCPRLVKISNWLQTCVRMSMVIIVLMVVSCTVFKFAQISLKKNRLLIFDVPFAFASIYRIVASTSPSRFEAHAGLFRLSMKGIFDAYVLWTFDQKIFFEFVTRVNTRDFAVSRIKLQE